MRVQEITTKQSGESFSLKEREILRTLALRALSLHVRNPITLRSPCCEKPKPYGKALEEETSHGKRERERGQVAPTCRTCE